MADDYLVISLLPATWEMLQRYYFEGVYQGKDPQQIPCGAEVLDKFSKVSSLEDCRSYTANTNWPGRVTPSLLFTNYTAVRYGISSESAVVDGMNETPRLPVTRDATPLSVAVNWDFIRVFLLLQRVTVDWVQGHEYPPEKVKATNQDYRRFAGPGKPITWEAVFRVFEEQIAHELKTRIAARQAKTEQPKAK